jgi:hypothetical protein
VGAISNAKSNESPLDANAPASRTDDRENLQDRRKPPVQLNKKPTIVVREPWPTAHLALQNDQLMAEHRILSFKPALRLEWRGQNPQNET